MGSEEEGLIDKCRLLRNNLENMLSGKIVDVVKNFDELTITLSAKEAKESFVLLRDHEKFSFDTLIDLCGLDCSGLRGIEEMFGGRFCVVYHLLSTTNNQRLRVKLFCSGWVPRKRYLLLMFGLLLSGLREAFDLFGIQFSES